MGGVQRLRSLNDLLDWKVWTEDPHTPSRRDDGQSGNLQAEAVKLVWQAGDDNRPTFGG